MELGSRTVRGTPELRRSETRRLKNTTSRRTSKWIRRFFRSGGRVARARLFHAQTRQSMIPARREILMKRGALAEATRLASATTAGSRLAMPTTSGFHTLPRAPEHRPRTWGSRRCFETDPRTGGSGLNHAVTPRSSNVPTSLCRRDDLTAPKVGDRIAHQTQAWLSSCCVHATMSTRSRLRFTRPGVRPKMKARCRPMRCI